MTLGLVLVENGVTKLIELPVCNAFGFGARGGGPDGARRPVFGSVEAEDSPGCPVEGFAYAMSFP